MDKNRDRDIGCSTSQEDLVCKAEHWGLSCRQQGAHSPELTFKPFCTHHPPHTHVYLPLAPGMFSVTREFTLQEPPLTVVSSKLANPLGRSESLQSLHQVKLQGQVLSPLLTAS